MLRRTWLPSLLLPLLLAGVASAADPVDLAKALGSRDTKIRQAAERELLEMGARAVPALLGVVAHGDIEPGAVASDVIVKIGPPAVAHLASALRGDGPTERRAALVMLARLGTQAKAAVPALAEALGHEDGKIRRGAAIALGAIGAEAAGAKPALARLAADTDQTERVRSAATRALRTIGDAKPAAPPRTPGSGAPGTTGPRKPRAETPPAKQPNGEKKPDPSKKPAEKQPGAKKKPSETEKPKVPTATWRGLTVGALTAAVRKRYEPGIEGVLVVKVAKANEDLEMIRPGDVLMDLGEQAIDTLADFKTRIGKISKDEDVVLVLLRGDDLILVEVGGGD